MSRNSRQVTAARAHAVQPYRDPERYPPEVGCAEDYVFTPAPVDWLALIDRTRARTKAQQVIDRGRLAQSLDGLTEGEPDAPAL